MLGSVIYFLLEWKNCGSVGVEKMEKPVELQH